MIPFSVILTQDGSHTLYREDIDETYHSRHGAITESEHIFINKGLAYWLETHDTKQVSVLEIGFGTGLNAALSMQYAVNHGIEITYTSLEPYPLDSNIIDLLNYFDDEANQRTQWVHLHDLSWSETHVFNHFTIQKVKEKFQDYDTDRTFDVIFFDAFAPEKQPDLWTLQMIHKLYHMLNPSGIMTTYCAKGEFQRNLRKAGFEVQKIPGPQGGKREMIRGQKVYCNEYMP